jgi:hypothetical protein
MSTDPAPVRVFRLGERVRVPDLDREGIVIGVAHVGWRPFYSVKLDDVEELFDTGDDENEPDEFEVAAFAHTYMLQEVVQDDAGTPGDR